MSLGLVGKKCGMTRIFQEDGTAVPVTVVLVEPNRVTQVRTPERDGYSALQVTMGNKSRARVNKPEAGHFAKAQAEAGFGLWEFVVDAKTAAGTQVGTAFGVSLFSEGQYVDVIGISKGRGYAGAIKRHNFQRQDTTHGNSLSHRSAGSNGQNQDPGRVFPGKKMAGHMGDVRVTTQNLTIVGVNAEKNLLLVKGAVPGANQGYVVVQPAVKRPLEARAASVKAVKEGQES